MYLEMDAAEVPPHLAEFFEPVPVPKAKSLLMIPERFALGMQERGWIVRSRIAWCKTSAMPESVRDRPTSAWEHIWMFSKSARYFYDADAVRQTGAPPDGRTRGPKLYTDGAYHRNGIGSETLGAVTGAANLRNFWLLGPEPSSLEHYAGFVTELPKRCILAGTSERGACSACGSPWARVVERVLATSGRTPGASEYSRRDPRFARGGAFTGNSAETTGWAPSCSCPPAEPRPCVVLDPFLGSGTTALVADRLGRDAIGIELNPTYARMARDRIDNDAPMVSEPVEVVDGDQLGLFEVPA